MIHGCDAVVAGNRNEGQGLRTDVSMSHFDSFQKRLELKTKERL